MHDQPPPLSRKKTVQLLVILTILAWATQTLFHQWGYGQTVAFSEARNAREPHERFVPTAVATAANVSGATLQLRDEARVFGREVKLKQIARWSDADAAALAPVADLTLAHLSATNPSVTFTLNDVKGFLRDAGVNLAVLRFAGPVQCTVTRADADFAELDLGAAAGVAAMPLAAEPIVAAGRQEPAAPATDAVPSTGGVRTLRAILLDDLAVRNNLPPDSLSVTFSPQDERVLNLAEPQFRFAVSARRARGLGQVGWDVTVLTEGGARGHKASVTGTARQWQNRVVVAKPLAVKQVVRDGDVEIRRVLTDEVSDDPLLTATQVLGHQAARDLKPGTVMTARMVDAVPLVRTGQFVSITLSQGGVRLKTVAKAMEGGSYGQTIKVRNEATKDVYEVTVTGPQTAGLGGETVAAAQ